MIEFIFSKHIIIAIHIYLCPISLKHKNTELNNCIIEEKGDERAW